MLDGGPKRAFVVSAGALIRPGTLGGDFSSATAVDPSGTVAGDSTLPNGELRSFLFSGGALSDLGTLGGIETLSFAISALGLGSLDDLVPGGTPSLLVALGINERGQILCTDGQSGAPRSRCVLLTPR